jgi:predicted nucleic acid-binding protein
MTHLRRRSADVLLPEKVAEEVGQPGSPMQRFLTRYPSVVTPFTPSEEDGYLQMLKQPGIDEGEAAAITLAISRGPLPIVIEDKRGRQKAENHNLHCLYWHDFIRGA